MTRMQFAAWYLNGVCLLMVTCTVFTLMLKVCMIVAVAVVVVVPIDHCHSNNVDVDYCVCRLIGADIRPSSATVHGQ